MRDHLNHSVCWRKSEIKVLESETRAPSTNRFRRPLLNQVEIGRGEIEPGKSRRQRQHEVAVETGLIELTGPSLMAGMNGQIVQLGQIALIDQIGQNSEQIRAGALNWRHLIDLTDPSGRSSITSQEENDAPRLITLPAIAKDPPFVAIIGTIQSDSIMYPGILMSRQEIVSMCMTS